MCMSEVRTKNSLRSISISPWAVIGFSRAGVRSTRIFTFYPAAGDTRKRERKERFNRVAVAGDLGKQSAGKTIIRMRRANNNGAGGSKRSAVDNRNGCSSLLAKLDGLID